MQKCADNIPGQPEKALERSGSSVENQKILQKTLNTTKDVSFFILLSPQIIRTDEEDMAFRS